MHEETYPTFFTPRDEEPSRSSSEFDWLERKITSKQKYEGKTKQVLCKIYFFLIQKVLSKNKLSRDLYSLLSRKLQLYIRGYSPLCSYLKTKESYDRWVTRRLWGFRQQISKAKYLKMSVGNIRKLQENTAALYAERKTLRVSAIRGSGYV